MATQHEDRTGRILRGVVAGLVAGVVASFAMDAFQAATAALSSSDDDADDSEPATEQAADAVARTVAGHELAPDDKPLGGQAMHYALGLGLGVAYGISAEFRPSVTAGYGTVFGIGTATILDEGAVPALGLGQAPWKAGLSGNLYAYASHVVFGGTAELVRRQVSATLRA